MPTSLACCLCDCITDSALIGCCHAYEILELPSVKFRWSLNSYLPNQYLSAVNYCFIMFGSHIAWDDRGDLFFLVIQFGFAEWFPFICFCPNCLPISINIPCGYKRRLDSRKCKECSVSIIQDVINAVEAGILRHVLNFLKRPLFLLSWANINTVMNLSQLTSHRAFYFLSNIHEGE